MLTINNIFTEDTVCVFTDSSTTKTNQDTHCCPGYCIATEKDFIDSGYRFLPNSSSNRGELYAILLGLQAAVRHGKTIIRLFSDSLYSIHCVRDYIFKWSHQGKAESLIKKDGEDVMNQDLIIEIIYFILNNNLKVEFYHQKGHVDNQKQFLHAIEVFCISNNISMVDPNLIKLISYYNNVVDHMTRNRLAIDLMYTTPAITFSYQGFDARQYRSLIYNTNN